MCITAHAKTETLNWYIDGNTYATTTCESGDDVLLPAAPTKRGYTFKGWLNYQPIEYLESTGTQYIDTGVLTNSEIELRFMFVLKNYSIDGGYSSILAARVSAQEDAISQGILGGNFYYGFGNNSEANITTFELNKKFSVIQNKYSILINNVVYSYADAYNTNFTREGALYMFARNVIGSGVQNFSIGRIYYAKIYDNDVLVRDMIPVLDAFGTPCMYDKVENKFYYNQGTGQFIAGPAI